MLEKVTLKSILVLSFEAVLSQPIKICIFHSPHYNRISGRGVRLNWVVWWSKSSVLFSVAQTTHSPCLVVDHHIFYYYSYSLSSETQNKRLARTPPIRLVSASGTSSYMKGQPESVRDQSLAGTLSFCRSLAANCYTSFPYLSTFLLFAESFLEPISALDLNRTPVNPPWGCLSAFAINCHM